MSSHTLRKLASFQKSVSNAGACVIASPPILFARRTNYLFCELLCACTTESWSAAKVATACWRDCSDERRNRREPAPIRPQARHDASRPGIFADADYRKSGYG